jgi:lipoic acid synthetase
MPVSRLVHPDEFEAFKQQGLSMGFKYVASGPLVRSSYKAGEAFIEGIVKGRQAEAAAALAADRGAPVGSVAG